MSVETLRAVRDDAINKLSAVITAMWGERCARFEGGCATCAAWAMLDATERITDGSTLDDLGDFKRVAEVFNLASEKHHSSCDKL